MQIDSKPEISITDERMVGKGIGNALQYFGKRGMLGSHY